VFQTGGFSAAAEVLRLAATGSGLGAWLVWGIGRGRLRGAGAAVGAASGLAAIPAALAGP